ncbi:hypothetical protein HYE68_001695 [Fusarium pseudograminearum]|nr:hypothetical protein HYE68_001695 [Fusarium pseudograminearum]
MQLLHLPPEIIKQVFNYIGSPFFQEDLTRLAISKKWFEFAQYTCYQDVTFSPRKLHEFTSSQMATRPDVLRSSLESLIIKFGTHKAPVNSFGSREPTARTGSCEAPCESTDGDLEQLATIIQQAPKLRFLRIEAYGSRKSDPLEGSEDRISLHSIQAVLTVNHLTSLAIDLPGGALTLSGGQEEACHICPNIGALIHKLKYLRLRMRNICLAAIRPRDSAERLRLNRLIVNLSLKMDLPGTTSAAHSKRCGPLNEGGFLQLKAEMQEQAEKLGAKMASPKLIRILTHTFPRLETHSLDVLSGSTTLLDESMRWDDDGNIVEDEQGAESDFSDDESLSWFDT